MGSEPAGGSLTRSLGLRDAVVIGLGSMVGAGVFAVWQPAARAAGDLLLVALALAALVATCNALSSASLAALYPQSGGTYVYGRERLGRLWGYLAGWCFVVGKTASCAAMAMTLGAYLWPGHAALLGATAVAAVTGLNLLGAQRSAGAMRIIIAVVIPVLVLAVLVPVLHPGTEEAVGAPGGASGVLQAAGLLFFAFAGYARIATMGEEVRQPARTIPRAIVVALGIALLLYGGVALGLLRVLGAAGIASHAAPVRAAAERAGMPWLVWGVVLAAGLATAGALLNLLLGVSRTLLAMARDGWFPRGLTRVDDRRHAVPWVAELVVAAVVVAVVLAADVRGAIGFSSFGVLTYYAVANASAMTLGVRARVIGVAGLVGCLLLAWSLPFASVTAGTVVLAAGLLWYALRSRTLA